MCLRKSFIEMNQNFECTHILTALLPPLPEGQDKHMTDTLWALGWKWHKAGCWVGSIAALCLQAGLQWATLCHQVEKLEAPLSFIPSYKALLITEEQWEQVRPELPAEWRRRLGRFVQTWTQKKGTGATWYHLWEDNIDSAFSFTES